MKKEIENLLNDQVRYEANASMHYLAMASWADVNGYNGVSEFFYANSEEERVHMIKLVKFIIVGLMFNSMLVIGGGAYIYFHPDSFPEPIPSTVTLVVDQGVEHYMKVRKKIEMAGKRRAMVSAEDQITLILKNGGIVQGRLLSESDTELAVRWEYGEAVFLRSEIAEIRQGRGGDDLSQDLLVPTFADSKP